MRTAFTNASGAAAGSLADLPLNRLGGLFTSSLLVGYSGALMPGPLLAAVVAGAATAGVWAGPAFVAGHGILELVVVLALARGLGAVLARPAVTRGIAGLGGVTLLWLGATMVRDGLGQRVVFTASSAPGFSAAPVIVGALVSASNPYWVLWWATAGASYVALALRRGAPGLTAFYAGHILSDLSWYALVAFGVASGRSLFGPAVYNGIIVVAGAFLAVMALVFLRAAMRSAKPRE